MKVATTTNNNTTGTASSGPRRGSASSSSSCCYDSTNDDGSSTSPPPPEVHYHMAMDVIDTWDKLKLKPNYMRRTGALIFERLFDLDPSTKLVFNVKKDKTTTSTAAAVDGDDSSSVTTSSDWEKTVLVQHSRRMVNMIDMTVDMLGPDLDALEDDLIALGTRHIKYGITSDSLLIMVTAVIDALELMLGTEVFGIEQKENWRSIFLFIVHMMKIGMKK